MIQRFMVYLRGRKWTCRKDNMNNPTARELKLLTIIANMQSVPLNKRFQWLAAQISPENNEDLFIHLYWTVHSLITNQYVHSEFASTVLTPVIYSSSTNNNDVYTVLTHSFLTDLGQNRIMTA